mmetsp:Transcript_14673/g.43310  ORF Transcript_14673/g.43310 Transcript_14673/m.43310 type:complete len:203 (+) Transcript_14673:1747-2355(+)
MPPSGRLLQDGGAHRLRVHARRLVQVGRHRAAHAGRRAQDRRPQEESGEAQGRRVRGAREDEHGLQQLSVRRGGGGGRLLLRRPHARPLGRAGASQGEGAGRGGQGSRHRGRAEGARRQPGGAGARRRVLQGGGQEGRPHRARDGDRRLPARRRPVEPGERLPDGDAEARAEEVLRAQRKGARGRQEEGYPLSRMAGAEKAR